MAVSRSIWQNIQQYSWLVLRWFVFACIGFGAITDMAKPWWRIEQPAKTEAQGDSAREVAATAHLGSTL